MPHIIPTGNKDHEIQHEHNNCVVGQYVMKQLSEALKAANEALGRYQRVDFDVYQAPEGILYHNVEEELTRNPLFTQTGVRQL